MLKRGYIVSLIEFLKIMRNEKVFRQHFQNTKNSSNPHLFTNKKIFEDLNTVDTILITISTTFFFLHIGIRITYFYYFYKRLLQVCLKFYKQNN